MTKSQDSIEAMFARLGITKERLLEEATAIAERYRADGSIDPRAAASFKFTTEFSADGEVNAVTVRILKLFDARELRQEMLEAGLLLKSPAEPMDERP